MERVYAAGTRPITVGRPISSGGGNDWDPNKLWSPTTASSPPSTVATRTTISPIRGPKPPLSLKLSQQLETALVGLAPKEKEEALKGKSSWMGNPFAKVGLGLLNYSVLKPLQLIDVGRRGVLSTVREGIDLSQGKGFSASDWLKQTTDVNLQSNELFNLGDKWTDKLLGFVIDVAADPVTYLTLGTGTAAKIALQQATKTIGKEATEALIKQAAQELATKSVKEVTANLSKNIAKELGKKATVKEIRIASRAAVSEAAKLAAEEGIEGGAKKAAQAAARYSAVGPRRSIGAGAREARANSLIQLKEEAVQTALRETMGTAQGRVAQRFVDTMTDDVIAKIAKRGSSGITDDIARELGLSGGLRVGAFGARTGMTTSIGKTAGLTRTLGRVASGIRMGTMNVPVGRGGKIVADIFTQRGATEAVYLARTGLRSDRILDPITARYRELTPKETLEGLETIAKDATYRQIVSAAKAPIKIAIANIAKKEYREFYDSVSDLAGVELETSLAKISAAVGREVTQKEAELAILIRNFGEETFDAIRPDLIKINPNLTEASGTYPKNWFPEVLTNDGIKFLNSGTPQAKQVLEALGLNAPPLPGQSIANALEPKVQFFGTRLTDTPLTIRALNDIARTAGFKGDFFEMNAFKAIQKFSNKYKGDYALARLIEMDTRRVQDAFFDTGSIKGVKPALVDTRADILKPGDIYTSKLAGKLTTGTVDELRASNVLAPWAINDIEQGQAQLLAARNRLKDAPITVGKREDIDQALNELDQIFKVIQTVTTPNASGVVDDLGNAWATLAIDLQQQYITLFARPKKEVLSFLNKLNPDQLKNMVNLGEDAFVQLNSMIAPDALVRAELANIYQNVQKLKNPKYANDALQVWDAFTQTVKTWYTSTPGFHTRNALSNWFQMIAGGVKLTYMKEGIAVSHNWNKFLKQEIALAKKDSSTYLADTRELVEAFIDSGVVPRNQQYAAREALLAGGGAGFGDFEEVFSKAVGKVGITGREATGVVNIPFTSKGIKVPALKGISEAAGIVPSTSRKIGNRIEDHSRFIMTFDGIRQGMDVQESVSRTSKFLIDYSDLSGLDDFAKRVIPFWMFMSRNLPTQLINMYTNPGIYQKYNAFRRNIEDEKGNNFLIPDYLTKAGATMVGGNVYIKPDLAFPSTGSPSPLTSTFQASSFGDAAKGVTQGFNPAIQALLEAFTDRDLFTGQEMGGKQQILSALEKALPPVSVLSRYLNPAFAGTDIPGIRDLPGIYQSETGKGNIKDTPDNTKKFQAMLSLLGIPVGLLTPNEINSRMYELIRAAESYRKKKK